MPAIFNPMKLIATMSLILCLTLGMQAADAPSFKIGDPAPAFKPSGWLNGPAIESLSTGTIYVIECWATWCPPCIKAMPHISALNTRFKEQGVVFIGLNVSENDQSAVAPFVARNQEKMNYRVALDADGSNGKAWLQAAGQDGIPCSFVIDKAGKLAWVGLPMDGLDQVIEQVVKGTFDAQAYAAKQALEKQKMQDLEEHFKAAIESKDASKIDAVIAEAAAINPDLGNRALFVAFKVMFTQQKVYSLANNLAKRALNTFTEADALNSLAWDILDTKDVPKADRDVALALKIALKAAALSDNKNAAILDTLAHGYFLNGDQAKAISTEELALTLAEPDQKADLTTNLERFKAGPATP